MSDERRDDETSANPEDFVTLDRDTISDLQGRFGMDMRVRSRRGPIARVMGTAVGEGSGGPFAYDRDHYDRDEYDRDEYDRDAPGYDRDKYDRDKPGYDRDKYDRDKYDRDHYDRDHALPGTTPGGTPGREPGTP